MMKTLLFNPFSKYSETTLLVVGLAATVIGSFAAYSLGFVFDGVLDIHTSNFSFVNNILYNFINIAIVTLMVMAVSYAVNKKTRFVDILNAALLYRIPFYISLFFLNIEAFKKTSELIVESRSTNNITSGDFAVLMLVSGISLVMLVWAICLLVNGFKVATNVKKTVHYVLFAVALLVAEILSKYIFHYLITT